MEIDLNEIYEEAINELPKELIKTPATTEEDEELSYAEEELLDILNDDFEYQIKQRGIDYYNTGNVIKVIKTENDGRIKYAAKVEGSATNPYEVVIDVDMDGVEYSCTCPYSHSCNHVYAVLMAMANKKYEVRTLKPSIKEKEVNLKSILTNIPAEELKKYILASDNVEFDTRDFENHFRKYYPNQKYDYYYNNLYNAMVF